MPSASKILGDLVSSAGAIAVTSGVANKAFTGTITTAQIADSAITTPKIADASIVTVDIADANVTDAKIVGVANTKVTGRMTASQIANTAVTAGVYGGSSNSALITVDAQGRITSASNVAASGYSGPAGLEVFNAPGTFTVPPGITSVVVQVAGGGGGGAGSTSGEGSNIGGAGGAGGKGRIRITGLTSGGTVPVTIGNGGNGGGAYAPNPGPGSGNAGNSTSFGPHITATGGNGAIANSPGNAGTAPGSVDVFYSFPSYGVTSAPKGDGGGGGGSPIGSNDPGYPGPNNLKGTIGGGGIVIVEY
jgi:hypothetical protein